MDVDLGVAGSSDLNRSRPDELTAAWIGLEMVRPNLCDEPADDDTGPRWSPRAAVDLLAGAPVGLERLPIDDYCGFDVKLGRMEDDPSPLGEDLVLILEGSTAGGTPFAIHFADEIEIEVDDPGSTLSDRAAQIGVLLQFELARWIADVDLDAVPRTEGVALVDQAHSGDLLETIERSVERSVTVHIDDDGDLVPDP